MENEMPKAGEQTGEEKKSFRSVVSNFLYHYKYHLIAVLFAVAVLIIAVSQCAAKEPSDLNVLYAGGHIFTRTGDSSTLPGYDAALSTLRNLAGDMNGDGKIRVTFTDRFCPSEADILAMKDEGKEINAALYAKDREAFLDDIRFGDAFLCILSEELFLRYDDTEYGSYFVDLADVLPAGADLKLTDSGRGVYLASTPIGQKTEGDGSILYGLSGLPEGTVLCLRKKTVGNALAGKKESEAAFFAAETALRRMLSPD